MRQIAILILLGLCPVLVSAEGSSKDLYLAGIQAYQKTEFAAAAQQFSAAAKLDPSNKLVLFNWGLSEIKQNHTAMAVALWRKTLAIDPDFSPARRALEFTEKSGGFTPWRSDISSYEWLRLKLLSRVTLDQTLLVLALLLTCAGFLGLRYFGQRKAAYRDHAPSPPIPTVAIFLSILTVIMMALNILKIFDDLKLRGTVVSEHLPVRSGPSSESPELFNLNGGTEVILRTTSNGWIQISYPGGIVGWVETSGLFQTSGRPLW